MLEIVDKIPVILNALPYILQGSVVTLITVIGSLALGFCIGLPLAVLQVYGPSFIRRLIGVYVWFFRGMPILLLLFLFYFGLFEVIGLNLSTITASCLVLGMASAAYQSQIFRGSIETLPVGQFRAARALGMNDGQAIRHIVLPQALRLSIPGWSNEFSILLKDSALCFVLGTLKSWPAPTSWPRGPTSTCRSTLRQACCTGITLVGVHILRVLERKVHIPGYAVSGSM